MLGRVSAALILSALASLGSATSAYADQFQIRDRATRTPIGFLKLGAGGRTYYTDNQGRVIIDLARGAYTVDLTYKDRPRRIPIQIDGAQVLKSIDLD
jgi:hypothetical protein